MSTKTQRRVVRCVEAYGLTATELRLVAAHIESETNEELAWDRVHADAIRKEGVARGEDVAPFENTQAGQAHAEHRAHARLCVNRLLKLAEQLDGMPGTTLVPGHEGPVAVVFDLGEPEDRTDVACILGVCGVGIVAEDNNE